MKIVRFENGMYGLRTKWLFGWLFVDLKSPRYQWRIGSAHFLDCQGTLDTVKNLCPNYEVL